MNHKQAASILGADFTEAKGLAWLPLRSIYGPFVAVMDLDSAVYLARLFGDAPWSVAAIAGNRSCPARVPIIKAHDGREVRPARVIACAGPGDQVRYNDGDPFKLRRSNLTIRHVPRRVGQDWRQPHRKRHHEHLRIAV